ncbi:HD domain-containing phosphohydrolase [Deinococcus yavapaiensis]|uniref:Tetratricopeptide repeat protein n=1 Tax=Deinococcus yavapaiensis KR-236 TaxID=694435 RepID=A0A318SEG8_9DEIO|nr:HD domain-containing phosphohydrolase [Deinococcus yavapaiensis]PYE51148.1 tetratricopeptide repeat protein [Deinococcus yavapaiensis KR-236]
MTDPVSSSLPDLGPHDTMAALLAAAEAAVSAQEESGLELADRAHAFAVANGRPDGAARANLLRGRVYATSEDSQRAVPVLTSAVQDFEALHDDEGRCEALITLGRLFLAIGELPLAQEQLQAALTLADENDLRAVKATALNLLAGVDHRSGLFDEALSRLRSALQLYRDLEDKSAEAKIASNIGLLYVSRGQYSDALEYLIGAYDLLRQEVSDARTENNVLTNLGHLYLQLNEPSKAYEYLRSALELARSRQDNYVEAVVTLNIGEALVRLQDLEEAQQSFENAQRLFHAINSRWGEANALNGLGSILALRAHFDAAERAHLEAAQIAEEIGDLEVKLEATIALGKAQARREHFESAVASFTMALTLAGEADSPKSAAEAHLALAEVFERAGDFSSALRHFQAYHEQDKALFNEQGDRRTRELTARFDLERAKHEAEVQRVRREAAEEAQAKAEALVRARTQELEQAHLEVVTRLAVAGESRDDLTGEHTWRVGHLAGLIARELRWSQEDATRLRIAARLHDVGKIGIPDSVLLKPGRYTPEEYEHMKTHTVIGARILSGGRSKLLQLAEEIALTHHERWDGAGYPFGRSGEDIPLAGRIVAVADVYDALLQQRSYKRAWSHEEACEELQRQAGTQFDPTVVRAALALLKRPDFPQLMHNDDATTTLENGDLWKAPPLLLPGSSDAS